ncbi:GDP-6-deoxy-D-lyxo-4-hexulose reductase [Azorhizobium oxalatiphilum]|uniref:GDP-6-deoxy-D-lyxo-4-hexulose reductase n=1 Tax=Azorhizobium oxalatiphilum TaxID=980631 RepID=A0A917FH79_9HYPH|nr:GDP-mannose 4,6-dehydratase [Azorhizobium oxalatiphilum]GGF80141.1 GDP-6-deoxy-D-lyxo-4-hexulose reductase [Azorhizobium oxalatiphilum]
MAHVPTLLLAGGNGFVGGYMAPALRAAFPEHRLVMLSRDEGPAEDGWSLERADLLEPESVEALVERVRPDIVVHLAAQSSIMEATRAAELTWRVNFGGTFALASAVARYAPGGLFLFSSSAEVYGASFVQGTAKEDTPPQPGNAYAASKLAAEHALAQVLPEDTRLIIARAFNHTGPGQDERFVLPTFAAQIARIEAGQMPPVVRVGDLSAQRDFLHVADVVRAYIGLLTHPDLARRTLVNVASGSGHRIGDLLEQLCGLSRAAITVEQDPARMRPSGVPVAIGDPAKLRKMTGWHPEHAIDGILSELLDWWRVRVRQPGA